VPTRTGGGIHLSRKIRVSFVSQNAVPDSAHFSAKMRGSVGDLQKKHGVIGAIERRENRSQSMSVKKRY
jgi:hypothetical protein